MRCYWLALAALLAGCGSEEVELPTGDIEYEVRHYDYTFDLETRAASSALTIDVLGEGDCLRIPFRATGLADVTLDGLPITGGDLQGDVLTACGEGWEAGTQLVLESNQVVREETWEPSQVGFSTREDLDDEPFTYLVSWVGGCDQFGPCDNRASQFARYRFEVAHAPGTTVLCSGDRQPGERVSVCDFELDGGPTYSTFGFAASPNWEVHDLGDWGGVAATLHDAPGSTLDGRFPAARAEAFLAWMEERFGPYPYGDEIRFFSGPTYWNGFEHPGNIALRDLLGLTPSAYARPVEHTTIHEIAHQWAGNQTTLADTYDFAWKEAMVEYLAFVFEDETAPDVALTTARYWTRAAQLAEYNLVPGEQPPLLDYYGDAYAPGPLILFRQIEALYDRDTVFEALGSLLGQQRAISFDDLRLALEAATGDDLTGYFDAWVYGTGVPERPTVDITLDDHGDGSYTVTAGQVVPGDTYYGAAFPVRLTGDGGETHDVWIDFGIDGAATASGDATPGFAVTGWAVNPDGHSIIVETAAMAALRARAANDPRHPWVLAE